MAAETMSAARIELDVEGIATTIHMAGEGPALVLLHNGHMGNGTEVSSSRMWEGCFSALAKAFTVIAIDRLGQGGTANPASPADFSLAASAAHVKAVLSSLGHGAYHLVGHDEGAFIAAQLAFEAPEVVLSVTLVSANSLTPGTDRRGIVHSAPPQPRLSRESLRWVYETSSHSHLCVPAPWLDEAEAMAASDKHRAAVEIMADEAVYLGTYVAQWTKKRSELHRRIHDEGLPCATLIVWGLNDPVAPLENGKYLLELLAPKQRNTELRIFNSAGHYPHWEHAATFARVVTSFAQETDKAARAIEA